MKRVLVVSCAFLFSCLPLAQALCADWSGVESVFGRKGNQQGIVFSIAFPRADLTVKVDSITLEPAFALSSWVGFRSMGSSAMIMGDMCLREDEVEPAMKKLVAGGLDVTAVHNHVLHESPRIMFMHFGGRGDAVRLAELVKSALQVTGTPLGEPVAPSDTAAWGNVESLMGFTGKRTGRVIHFGVPRLAAVTENSMDIPPALGVASSINFQKVGENAAVTGDLVLISSEVNPVVKSLTDNGIAVTALHSHMLFEVPRLYFLHFWGVGNPETLARALRGALEWTASARK